MMSHFGRHRAEVAIVAPGRHRYFSRFDVAALQASPIRARYRNVREKDDVMPPIDACSICRHEDRPTLVVNDR